MERPSYTRVCVSSSNATFIEYNMPSGEAILFVQVSRTRQKILARCDKPVIHDGKECLYFKWLGSNGEQKLWYSVAMIMTKRFYFR